MQRCFRIRLTAPATILTLAGTDFLVGRLVNIYPVEAGIIAAYRASQGGTRDVAILSASNRLQMMPFALAFFARFGR